jgi:hypothetical protein
MASQMIVGPLWHDVPVTRSRSRRDGAGHEASARGHSGESLLQWWASQERISATKTERDVDGWDVTLDVPAPVSPQTHPLDLHAPPAIARVQVKAKKKDFRSIRIRLRIARAMAQQPVPWFLVCVVMPERDPVAAYVVHIDEHRIEHILRAAREATHDRATVKISWTSRDRVPPNASAVFGAIRAAAGDARAYAELKVAFTQAVGYQTDAAVLKLSVDATPDAIEAAIDLGLGLRQRLYVREAALHDQRFGVSREVDRATETEIESHGSVPPSGTCHLQVVHGTEWAEQKFALLTMNGVISPELTTKFPQLSKIVLRNEFLDLIIVGDRTYQLVLHLPERLPLRAAAHAARFARLLYRHRSATGTIHLNDAEPTPIHLDFAGQELTGQEMCLLVAIETIARVMTMSDTSLEHWTPSAYIRTQQLALIRVAAFLGIDELRVSQISDLSGNSLIRKDALVVGLPVVLDAVHVLFCLHIAGKRTVDEPALLLVETVSVLDRHVLPLGETISDARAHDLLSRSAAHLGIDADIITPSVLPRLTLRVARGRATAMTKNAEDKSEPSSYADL